MKFSLKRLLIATALFAVVVALMANSDRWGRFVIPLNDGEMRHTGWKVDPSTCRFVFDYGRGLDCRFYVRPVDSDWKLLNADPALQEEAGIVASTEVFHPIGLGYNHRADLLMVVREGKLCIRDLLTGEEVVYSTGAKVESIDLMVSGSGRGATKYGFGTSGSKVIAQFKANVALPTGTTATEYEIVIYAKRIESESRDD